MINQKVNIFEFATKELSQDALLLYLADCYNDERKQKIGELFIQSFFETDITGLQKIYPIKQYKNIDILLVLDYGEFCKLFLIEDKVWSSAHDNQLERYQECLQMETFDCGGIEKTIKERKYVYYKPYIYNKNERTYCTSLNYLVKEWKDLEQSLIYGNDDYICNSFFEYGKENYKEIFRIAEDLDKGLIKDKDLSTIMESYWGQWKIIEYLLKDNIEIDTWKIYQGSSFGRPWTHYRFVFDKGDFAENWGIQQDIFDKQLISKYAYFFRVDKDSQGYYIACRQFIGKGREFEMEDKKSERRFLANELEKRGVPTKVANGNDRESNVAIWHFDNTQELEKIKEYIYISYQQIICLLKQ